MGYRKGGYSNAAVCSYISNREFNKLNGCSPKDVSAHNRLNPAPILKKLKKEINVVWFLKDSGAALDGCSLSPDGISNRHAKKEFTDLMNKLEFPPEVQNRYFLSLIPVTDADSSLKTIEQYQEDKEIIQKIIYEYYKKKSLQFENQYMQGIGKLNPIIINIESYIDLIHTGHFNTIQKDILMDAFMNTLQIDALNEVTKILLNKANTFQSADDNSGTQKPSDYYQNIWDNMKINDSSKEESS